MEVGFGEGFEDPVLESNVGMLSRNHCVRSYESMLLVFLCCLKSFQIVSFVGLSQCTIFMLQVIEHPVVTFSWDFVTSGG